MREKRRNDRKRVLRYGESQRPDGRYQFKYHANDGKVKFVYSYTHLGFEDAQEELKRVANGE